jgi:cephalosporin hydroxylase
MTFDRQALDADNRAHLAEQSTDVGLARLAREFVVDSDKYNYAYQWTWCGLPILQLPQDVVATQEIIFRCRPTVIIETGVAWGGGIALYATLMDLLGGRLVVGVDLNLAQSVVADIKSVGFKTPVDFYHGSSTSEDVFRQISGSLKPDDRVMVLLDSNHTHAHVLDELHRYAPLVTPGQYCIVSDTIVEFIPTQEHRPRPWGQGDNPMTAVRAYLTESDAFEVDQDLDARLLMSFNPSGYLRRRP